MTPLREALIKLAVSFTAAEAGLDFAAFGDGLKAVPFKEVA